MSTLFVCVPADKHTLEGHPENAGRVQAILRVLDEHRATADLRTIDPQPASLNQLKYVHTTSMVEMIRQAAAQNWGRLDADTYVTPASYDLACLAAGTAAATVDEIMAGRSVNGIVLLRPPGHHAEKGRPGGFCLFNNVAIAARHAQIAHQVQRVLIIDFDVHHGNGTQDIFYDDPDILFVSLHLFLKGFFYPGTGAADEIGAGPGEGKTLNIPLPPGVGDSGYQQAFSDLIWLKARQFQPELILISAGYDAHWADPLTPYSNSGLSLTGYSAMAREIMEMAQELCEGRVLFILEGGYYFPALSYGVLNTIHSLSGRDEIVDPLGPALEESREITKIIRSLQQQHLLI
jgi:acetoin utilization deacetylase AcuC-like enzyme